MVKYNEILKPLFVQARLAGACSKFKGNETLPELVSLFKSPQGIEFCIGKHFPNMATFRLLKDTADLTLYGIYIDAGNITLENPGYVVLIGHTSATISVNHSDFLHKVVAMHGAKCILNASGWSVTKTEVGQGSIIVKNCSDNAMIL